MVFLSDPGEWSEGFAIEEYTDPEHNLDDPAHAGSQACLVIHSIYNSYWFWDVPRSSIFGMTYAR